MSPSRRKPPSQHQLTLNELLGLSSQSGSDDTSASAEEASPQATAATPDSEDRTYLTVSDVTRLIQEVWEHHPILGQALVVRGEISNFKRSSRGHVYFTLKDDVASINGIIWASMARAIPFNLENGLEIFVTGYLEIYAPNGTYSLVCKHIQPVGIGPLQLAFEQIKARLEAEGLFSDEWKKPLPLFPERVGIVTSRTGAVIHDMLRVIRNKHPGIHIVLAPVKVQGQGAAEEIATGINALNSPTLNLDVLIVARGGGSFEDLFCFSEEPVVRAIFASRVPVITGIGHQPDYSLADAVADYSASTPTAAAERAVPDRDQLITGVALAQQELVTGMSQILLLWEQQFDQVSTGLIDQFERGLTEAEQRLQFLQQIFLTDTQQYYQNLEQAVAQQAAALDALSPLATLARGFSVVTAADGTTIASVQQTIPGQRLTLKFHDGQRQCEVLPDAPC